VNRLSNVLLDMGVKQGDRVAFLGPNCHRLLEAYYGVVQIGAILLPLNIRLLPADFAYILADAEASLLFVDRDLLHLIEPIKEELKSVRQFVLMSDEAPPAGWEGESYEELMASAPAEKPPQPEMDENDVCELFYTSGTTGRPKGVMLTHRNIVHNVLASTPRIPVRRRDVALEFLPLCHVFERMVGYIYMWCSTYRAYCSIYHVGDLIADIRPHIFAAVPRFYEKVFEGIQTKLAQAPPFRRTLFHHAVAVGRQVAHRRIAGREIPLLLKKRHELADRLVLSKVREALGGRVRFAISGGAELPLHLGEFFHAVGIPVMEGYGLTETSPVIAVNGAKPGQLRLGTVGKPLVNLDIKIEEDSELLVRGPSVMRGYWNKPEMTAEVLDEEGYFRTGDLAEIDDDGFLLITGRKKDLIVTAGGKNVAPQPIEASLMQSPLVEFAVLIGDGRPYLVVIISPGFEALESWVHQRGIEFAGREDLVTRPQVITLYQELVDSVNAGRAPFEQIKRFALVPVNFTVEDGQLTPTMKIKRRVIEQRYGQLIDRLYS